MYDSRWIFNERINWMWITLLRQRCRMDISLFHFSACTIPFFFFPYQLFPGVNKLLDLLGHGTARHCMLGRKSLFITGVESLLELGKKGCVGLASCSVPAIAMELGEPGMESL